MMDVKTLCLGVLTEGDKTGYEIKQSFEEAFNHFFGAGFGSIYPALAELTKRGLVSCRSVEQDKRPDKKVYSLTCAGHAVLQGELAATPPRHKIRSEFLVLMYFAHLLPPERIGAVIDEMVAQWQPLLAEIDACMADEADDAECTPGMRFAAGYGRAVMGAAIAYVQAQKEPFEREVAAYNASPPGEAAAAE